jgi:hypothetical protein
VICNYDILYEQMVQFSFLRWRGIVGRIPKEWAQVSGNSWKSRPRVCSLSLLSPPSQKQKQLQLAISATVILTLLLLLPEMLLAKAPPAPIPANLSAKPKPRLLEPNWKSSRGLKLVVRAGYTRTPLETSGAYQLIDDDTGEKFIVWGGSDDDNHGSPIPSKNTLSWKPSTANILKKKERYNGPDDAGDTTTSITGNYANEAVLSAQILNFCTMPWNPTPIEIISG